MNLHSWKTWFCILGISGVLVACNDKPKHVSPSERGYEARVNAKAIMDDPVTNKKVKALKLVEAGEQLFTPIAFFLADGVFKEALKLDPENKKAQLYLAILKPMMNTRGIIKRIEPLMKRDEREYAKYKAQLDSKKFQIRGAPTQWQYNVANGMSEEIVMGPATYMPEGLADFLTDDAGLLPIANEKTAQMFLQMQAEAYDELRKFINKNIGMELDLNISEHWRKDRKEMYKETCEYTVITDFDYGVKCKENHRFMKVKIDRGELEVLKGSTAGMVVHHYLAAAYDATDLQKVIQSLRDKYRISHKDGIETAFAMSDKIGVLNKDNNLSKILGLGMDAMIGVHWVKDNYGKLCPPKMPGTAFYYDGYDWKPTADDKFKMSDRNIDYKSVKKEQVLRREGFLLDRGICIYDEFPQPKFNPLDRIADTVDLALKGSVITVRSAEKIMIGESYKMADGTMAHYYYPGGSGKKVEAQIKPSVAFSNPVKDLRDIRPEKYNDCEDIYSFVDNTLGGVFVNGDADVFLRKTKNINQDEGQCGI